MSDEQRLDAQIISQAVEIGIASQLDDIEKLKVNVKTDLGSAVQGQVDAVSIAGTGMTVQKDIRVQEIEVTTKGVAIDPISALLGKLKLQQPVEATIRLELNEVDLNQTLNSDYVREKLFPVPLEVNGKTVTLELQQPLDIYLPGDEKVEFRGNLLIQDSGSDRKVGFSTRLIPKNRDRSIMLESFYCTYGGGMSIELTTAFMQKIKEVTEQTSYDIEGKLIRIVEMQVQKGAIVLQVEAHVKEI